MKQLRQRLDMGYRLDEFEQTLRGFCKASPALHCSGVACDWRLSDDRGLEAAIRARPLPSRRIGMLDLPRLEVELSILAADASAIDGFIQGFHRHFHKGGG